MGVLTRVQLVQRGLVASGCNPALTQELNFALNQWLREMNMRYPWPILKTRFPLAGPQTGQGVPFNQGAQLVTVGAGQGNVTDAIARFYDPLFIYTSDYGIRGEVRIRASSGGTMDDDEVVNNPLTNAGLPQICKLRKLRTTLGQWQVQPLPVPDRSYLGAIDYDVLMPDSDTTPGGAGDSVVPWYENDRTMVQFVTAFGYWLSQRFQASQAAMAQVQSLVVEDRAAYGEIPGTNDNVGLDEGVFRTTPPSNFPTWGTF